MVNIPNRDYRFKRMMMQAIVSCAPPSEYQNVGIVCLPGEERELFAKIVHHTETVPRPMTSKRPELYMNYHGAPCLRFTDTDSSLSILSEPEDFHGRTFESIYIVSDTPKLIGPQDTV